MVANNFQVYNNPSAVLLATCEADPMTTNLRVLIIEDMPDDAEIMALLLREEGFVLDWRRVDTEADYITALGSQPDLILADWSLPTFSGLRALEILREQGHDIPFIIVSGGIGEEGAVNALHLGAFDCIPKDHPVRLGWAVRHALAEQHARLEHRAAEDALRLSEEKYRFLVETSLFPVTVTTFATGAVLFANTCARRFFGVPEGTLPPDLTTERFWSNPEDRIHIITELQSSGHALTREVAMRTASGESRYIIISAAPVEYGGVPAIFTVFSDVTDRRNAEMALHESLQTSDDIVQTIPSGLFVYQFEEPDHLYLLKANPEAERLTGISCEKHKGLEFNELWPAARASGITARYLDVMRTGEVLDKEDIDYQDDRIAGVYHIRVFRLPGARLAVAFENMTERRQMEEALREGEYRYRSLLEQTMDVVWRIDLHGILTFVSPAVKMITGYDPDEIIGRHVSMLLASGDVDRARFSLEERIAGKLGPGPRVVEYEHLRKDGSTFPGEVSSSPYYNVNGAMVGVQGITRDITERKQAEGERSRLREQLLQSQKMESVGRLAGGVAHDSNNMLHTILGYVDMALDEADPDCCLYEYLLEIQNAAQRSAGLTRQLLAFARKQTISPKVIDLNDAVSGMLNMLGRLIGEDINLVWIPGPAPWYVRMDPSQVDQLLANLVVNARDAIDGVGRITLETHNLSLRDRHSSEEAGVEPGEYILLRVSDTGRGMSKEIQAHIFEPFFTTKDVGEGTGLGLATVYGIVTQNEGHIKMGSEPGKGTCFDIYLQRFHEPAPDRMQSETRKAPTGGTETILMVEDEVSILRLGKMVLERLGYRVLAAGTPDEAINLAREHAGAVDLLITDVVMPGMNGRDLAREISSIQPKIKCLFMSGYTASIIARHGVLEEGASFIQKPFAPKAMAAKVREALDAEQGHMI